MGKGVLGAMTKPLGGAAELVSQTGMGLLQGAGLARYPKPRRAPLEKGGAKGGGGGVVVLGARSGALRMQRLVACRGQEDITNRFTRDILFR